MSSKRPAPSSWDEVPYHSQSHPHKAPRLDTGDEFTTMDDSNDDFAEDHGLFDDEILQDLLENVDNDVAEPPLSVLRDFQLDSSNTETFDPKLNFSPVKEGEDAVLTSHEELDSEGINWDEVADFRTYSQADTSPDSSFAATDAIHSSPSLISSPSMACASSGTMDWTPELSNMRLRPLKTFFRLSEMLEAKMSTFRNSHDTVFELFARVVYSSRENFGHKQYFQFRDLFEESPPYLSGALSG